MLAPVGKKCSFVQGPVVLSFVFSFLRSLGVLRRGGRYDRDEIAAGLTSGWF